MEPYGMFNPDSFSFDEEKLKKEVVGSQAETFSEENRIDSVIEHTKAKKEK